MGLSIVTHRGLEGSCQTHHRIRIRGNLHRKLKESQGSDSIFLSDFLFYFCTADSFFLVFSILPGCFRELQANIHLSADFTSLKACKQVLSVNDQFGIFDLRQPGFHPSLSLHVAQSFQTGSGKGVFRMPESALAARTKETKRGESADGPTVRRFASPARDQCRKNPTFGGGGPFH